MRLIFETMPDTKAQFLPWFEIHLATILFGVAGLFGKFIQLPATYIVFGRAFFACIALALVIHFTKLAFRLYSAKDLKLVTLLGAVLALHWFSFFYSIQLSTVAIGLLSFSSFPLFVTLMEPYFFREKIRAIDLLTVVITVIGVVLVVPDFELGNRMTQGVLWGVLSGFTFAIISLLNRRFIRSYSGTVIAFYQNGIASIFLIPIVFWGTVEAIQPSDLMLLAVLGVVFTALAHTMFIRSMAVIKAQQVSIIVSLEPVYGIAFAIFLLNELPSSKTLTGGVLIVLAAILASIFRAK